MPTATKPKRSHGFGLVVFSAATELDQGLRVPALAFVEGTHTDALGKRRTYKRSDIETYATNSNTCLASGDEIPIFDSPHDLSAEGYSNKNKIGLCGQFSAREITAEMLPKPEFSDLIGKLGLYTELELTRQDAIEGYRRKLIKPISVGLGNFGRGPQVFEVSAVPWGAVRGAMLFSHPMSVIADDEDAEESGTPENKQIFALTLDGAIAENEENNYMPSDVDKLTSTFASVVRSIKTTTDAELQGRDRSTLLRQAVDDLSTRLRTMLNVTALTPVLADGETFSRSTGDSMATETDSTDQQEQTAITPDIEARFSAMESKITASQSRAEAAEAKLARMEEEKQTGDRYLRLRQKAASLNTSGKLSRAAFLAYFPEGEQMSEAIARFSATPTAEGEGAEEVVSLDEIEAALKYAEKFGTAVTVGSLSGGDPLPSPGAASAEEDDDMARFNSRRGVPA